MFAKLIFLMCWLTADSAESNKSSYCNDPCCNPYHQPYPNIFATMIGYNIVKGNPFTLSKHHDPGFATSSIFRALVMDSKNRYKLHEGVTVRKVVKCDLSLTTSAVSSVKQYQALTTSQSSKDSSFVANIDTEVKATILGALGFSTVLPPLVQSSFVASKEFRENSLFFSKTQGIVTVNDATCTSYTMHLSTYNPPPFTLAFEKALEELNAASNDTDEVKDREFEQFVNNFGTHYLAAVAMGARLAITRRYRREEYQRASERDIHNCNSWRLKLALGISFSKNSSSCDNFQSDSKERIDNIFSREYVSSYGSKPAKDLLQWSRENFASPLPIKMNLSPIINVFQSSFMQKYPHINFRRILEWITPRYYNYCTKYKTKLGVESCEIHKTGCGFDDGCLPKTQQCVQMENTTTCCDNACLKNPCNNNGLCIDQSNCTYRCNCTEGYSGETCQERLIVRKLLFNEMQEFLRIHQGNRNQEILSRAGHSFQKAYGHHYLMSILSYAPVHGDEYHFFLGNYVASFRKYERNLVIAWQNRKSRTPSKTFLDVFQEKLLRRFQLRGCRTQYIVERALKMAQETGYPVQMVAAVRSESGLLFGTYAPGGYLLNYVCSKVMSWGSEIEYKINLIIIFGEN